ncbi:MAG: RICIN domain-containing protein [Lachnospiraceae bacterium]|nr:RICIN domain-containing protein [Lachnospiraceae bacterium]
MLRELHPDEGTTGVLMPISVSHVYNLADCHTDSRFGKGFRLSLMQELKASGNTDFPYVLIDADGTSHYFYRDTEDENKLKDEDGLGFVITETDGDIFNARMVMEDKNKVRYIFGEDSYLRQIVDLNGNTIECQYGLNAAGNTLDRASDPTGAMVEFWYTDGYTRLDHIEANGRFTYFGYDAEGHLTTITYPDGKESRFAYNGDKLLYAEDPDGYRITYSYTEDCMVDRVSQIQEGVAVNNVVTETGTTIRIDYPALGTTVFTEPGLDGQIGTGTDNRVFTWKFNRFGTAAEVSDNAGHVSAFEHCAEQENRHRLRQTAFTGKVVNNLLANSGFDSYTEFYDTWSNTTTQENEDDWGVGRMTDRGYFGDTSILVLQETTSGHTAVCQTVTDLPAGTYTLSAYAYVGSIVLGNGSGNGAALGVKLGNGAITWSDEKLTEPADEDIDRGWRRIRQTFTVLYAQDVTIYGGLTGASGTVWFDCFQLEKGDRANRFNLVNNNCFADGNLAGWETEGLESTDGVVNDIEKGKSLLLYGNPEGNKRVSQNIYVSGQEGDVYRFGCFAFSEAIPEKEFRLTATVNYTDGSHKSQEVDIDPYRSGWQYVSGILSTDDEDSATAKAYNSLTLSISYNNQLNPAMFTSMQLMKDDTISYTYDSKGNLNTAKKTQENASFRYDEKNLLNRLAAHDGSTYEYFYDDQNQLIYAKSAEGIRSTYQYNENGQPVSVSMEADPTSAALTDGRVYYIRSKRSGKYLHTVSGGTDGSNVVQKIFDGSDSQKWKVVSSDGGYIRLISLAGSGTLALDIADGTDDDGINVQLSAAENSRSQQLMAKPEAGGGYLLQTACTGEKRCVMVDTGTTMGHVLSDGANVLQGAAEGTGQEIEARAIWYFEPVADRVGDEPGIGKILRLRARHSGQYLRPAGGNVTADMGMQTGYASISPAEEFLLEDAGLENSVQWYAIKPVDNTSLCLDVSSIGSDGFYHVLLKTPTSTDAQKFRFRERTDGYVIEAKTGRQLDVKSGSYEEGADVIATPNGGDPASFAHNKVFVLEEASRHIISSLAYTSGGRNVAVTTDARGEETTYTYDSDNRLLTRVNDPNNHTLDYSYDSDTDQLTGVEADMGGGISRSVAYSYDDADRLKTITHNGTVYSYEYDGFGNQTSVKVGNGSQTASTLEDYEYYPGNGPLKKVTYGNGDVQQTGYNAEERVSSRSWNGTETVRYAYDADGNLEEEKDFAANRTRRNRYDTTGRLVRHYTEAGTGAAGSGETLQALEVGYDSMNRVESLVQVEGDHKLKTTYLYGKPENQQVPGLSYGLKVDGVTKQELDYDSLGRRTEEKLYVGAGSPRCIQYSYGTRNSRISTDPFLIGMDNGSKSYSYTYDNAGNITKIVAGNQTISYAYDACNQLVRENNQVLGKTILYSYDLGGNMTSRTEHAYTTGTPGAATKTDTFTYGNTAWKDQMTAYNGTSITYDGSGNPLQYRGMTFTWQRGRYLRTVTKNGITTTFQYDAQGRRISKTTGGTTTEYYYNGSTLTALKKGNDLVQFVYDASGRPVFMRVNGVAEYAYLYNGQGDVTGLVDSGNNEVVSYEYDSWGKVVSTTDTSGAGIGSLNPFRYRGYVYDAETGLYFLQARYYDPETIRFVSPDDVASLSSKEGTLYEMNLYAYCDNNAITRLDSHGDCWWAIAAAVGAVVGATSSILAQLSYSGKVDLKTTIIDSAIGAAGGVLTASGVCLFGQVVGNAALSMAEYALTTNEIEPEDLAISCVVGMAAGFIGGEGLGLKQHMGRIDYSRAVAGSVKSAQKNAMYAAKIVESKKKLAITKLKFIATSFLAPHAIHAGSTELKPLLKYVQMTQ